MSDKECFICCDNTISENLNCYTCNKKMCISCCNKLDNKSYIYFDNRNEVFIKYKCPYCREYNNKNLKLFNKNEGSSFFINLLKQYIKIKNDNEIYKNQNEVLEKNKATLNNEIQKKEKTLKNVISINSSNIIEFNKIINKYQKII